MFEHELVFGPPGKNLPGPGIIEGGKGFLPRVLKLDTCRLKGFQELRVRAWIELWIAESYAQFGSDSVRPLACGVPNPAHPCRIHRETVNLHPCDD